MPRGEARRIVVLSIALTVVSLFVGFGAFKILEYSGVLSGALGR